MVAFTFRDSGDDTDIEVDRHISYSLICTPLWDRFRLLGGRISCPSEVAAFWEQGDIGVPD